MAGGFLHVRATAGKGRAPKPLVLSYLRDLTEADVAVHMEPRAVPVVPPSPLARLRATHHKLARLLAEGRKIMECTAITGYTQGRIWQLQQDPAFQELVEFYRTKVEAQYLDVHERLALLGVSTIEELQQRLEEEPEKFANKDLMALAELTLDRSVAPSKSAGGALGGPAQVPTISIKFVTPEGKAPLIEGKVEEP